ncbi:MAG: hypothetical protein QM478_00730 [Flavobacteriaceae bacterium]
MIYSQFNKKEKIIFYSIVALFVIFLIFRLFSKNLYLSDSYEYLEVAKRIHDLSFFDTNISGPSLSKRTFIYPLFLVFFLNSPIVFTIILQSIIGVITVFLMFKIINRFGLELKPSYLWFFIFTPSIFIYTQLIMSEWVVMFLVTLLFWVLIKSWTKKNFAYIQIITLILAFTKPIFYPLIYLNLIFFGIYFIRIRRFSFWLFIPIIILQSYLTFNEVRTGYRHFSSIENINLIKYNLYYFKSKTESEKEADQWLNTIYNSSFEEKSFKDQNIYLREIAVKEIKEHFFQYALYHFYTSVRGAFDPGRYDLMSFFKKEDGNQGFLRVLNGEKPISDLLKNKFALVYIFLIPIFLTILIKWFYFIKYLLINKLDFKTYYIILVLVFYILITGPVNSSRYLMPFQGVIIVFAILGINSSKKEITPQRYDG